MLDALRRFMSSAQVSCVVPARTAPGLVQVELTANGIDYYTGAGRASFTYFNPLQIASLHPAVGVEDGGTTVTAGGGTADERAKAVVSQRGVVL